MKLLASLLILSLACICLIYVGYRFGHRDGLQEQKDPVKILFELCGNGAHLINDGKEYMVVCVPTRVEK